MSCEVSCGVAAVHHRIMQQQYASHDTGASHKDLCELINYDAYGFVFFFQAEDGIRDVAVTGVQTCALPICQSAAYAREGIELDVSTLADWVGASSATLMPLVEAIRAHVFAAERIHADEPSRSDRKSVV